MLAQRGWRCQAPNDENDCQSKDSAESQGHYDQAEYDRQLEHGVDKIR